MKKIKHSRKNGIVLKPLTQLTTSGKRQRNLEDIDDINHKIYNDLPLYSDEEEDEK